jgi:ribosomal protein L44E
MRKEMIAMAMWSFLWLVESRMKKIEHFCPQCDKETTHREKKKSFRRSKKEGYGTIILPLKCMVCNYQHGKTPQRKIKQKKHISFN